MNFLKYFRRITATPSTEDVSFEIEVEDEYYQIVKKKEKEMQMI